MLEQYSKNMKLNPTKAEYYLYIALQNSILKDKFVQQKIINKYIVDFCINKNFVIEIGGGYHDNFHQRQKDLVRTKYLEKLGYKVVRFTNQEIYHKINYVMNKIISMCNTPEKRNNYDWLNKPKSSHKWLSREEILKFTNRI